MTTSGVGRGGRREGAGAPKGNTSRARHGRRSADTFVREASRHLPPELLPEFFARVAEFRKGRSIEAFNQPSSIDRTRPPLRLVGSASLPPSPPPGVQSNLVYGDVVARLDAHHFRNPEPFVRQHYRRLDALEAVLDYADSLTPEDARNTAGLIRDDFHLSISVPGRALGGVAAVRCPDCRWLQTVLPEEETGT